MLVKWQPGLAKKPEKKGFAPPLAVQKTKKTSILPVFVSYEMLGFLKIAGKRRMERRKWVFWVKTLAEMQENGKMCLGNG